MTTMSNTYDNDPLPEPFTESFDDVNSLASSTLPIGATVGRVFAANILKVQEEAFVGRSGISSLLVDGLVLIFDKGLAEVAPCLTCDMCVHIDNVDPPSAVALVERPEPHYHIVGLVCPTCVMAIAPDYPDDDKDVVGDAAWIVEYNARLAAGIMERCGLIVDPTVRRIRDDV
jgi:hypothetical protein